jgi:hypothetical protein
MNDPSCHAEQGDAIAMYIRWRNARAQPKGDFAPGSVIRTWTNYQPESGPYMNEAEGMKVGAGDAGRSGRPWKVVRSDGIR